MVKTKLIHQAVAAALVCFVLLSHTNAHDQIPGVKQSAPILLKGGDLYTVSDGVQGKTDLLIVDGKISAIGANLSAPAGATTIDVSGKRVYPGLIATNTTLGLMEVGAVRATNDINEVGRVKPEIATHIAYHTESELIPTIRSNGIAIAQIVPGGGLLPGRSFIANLDAWTKEDAAVKLIDGLWLNWPSVSINTAWWESRSADEQRKEMSELREQLRVVFREARAYDKARTANSSTKKDLRWEAMRPIFKKELPVYIQADDYRQIVEAVTFADEQQIRMILVGGREANKAADLLKSKQIPVMLSNTTSMPYRQDDSYDSPFSLPKKLHDSGVRFSIGLFANWDVRNLPFQAGYAAAFGLTQDQALRAVTLSPAEILGIADQYGSLSIGKSGTVVVSEGDLLDMQSNKITTMLIDGRMVDLDNRHSELYRKYQQKHWQKAK